MKMQSADAAAWFAALPPVLAKLFHMRALEYVPAPSHVASVALSLPRFTLESTGQRSEILVPLDFSSGSMAAAKYAIDVARRSGARVVLLHAVHLNLTPYGPANPDWLRVALCREALGKMETLMLHAQSSGVSVISVIEEGSPTKVIAGAAKRWNADLVVLASSKKNRLAKFFGPRIKEKVIREAGCPVMVLQTPVNEKEQP